MHSAKLKNIVILILTAVNVFLLVLVLPRTAEERRAEREITAQIIDLVGKNDISLDPDIIPDSDVMRAVTVVRDTAEEARALNCCWVKAPDRIREAAIYTYTGTNGSMTFRAGGEFEAEITSAPRGQLFSSNKVGRLLKKNSNTVLPAHLGHKRRQDR
jgi:hypothetical protein